MKVIEMKPNLEPVARFAHEGLPYMLSDDNWLEYDKTWVVEVWWDITTTAWRATAYQKDEDREINLEKGFDLF
jgi:hypothetical protein